MTIGLLGALLAGMLTLLSPCSVMLLPAFFAYAFTNPAAIIARTGIFFAGLSVTLVPLGLLAGSLGLWIQQYRETIVLVAAVLVIALGVAMMAGVPIPGLTRQRSADSTSIASVFALGTIYGVAGVCAGPLLGAVLTVAGAGANPLYGGLIMFAFATGMVIPLLVLALLWERVPAIRSVVKPRTITIGRWSNTWTQLIGGLLTLVVGVILILTNGTASLGSLLTVEQQFTLETSVMRFAAEIPPAISALIAIAILALVWWIVWFRPKRRSAKTAGNPNQEAAATLE